MRTRTRRASALLDTRVKALRRQLPLAIDGDVRGVHQARVASRRLREALPVLGKGLKGSKASKANTKVRKLTRALGAVRELDVSLELLDELQAPGTLSPEALAAVRAHVLEERARRREAMLERIAATKTAKLGKRLATLDAALLAHPDHNWRQTLATRLLARARAVAEEIDRAGQLYSPEHLHQVRIAVKKLRYGVELAADGGIAGGVALVRSLKRAQATLGRLHDLQVLQSHVGLVQVEAPARSGLHDGLAAVAGWIEEQCRLLHGRYIRTVPDLREVIVAVRRDLVAQLTRVAQPVTRRALKMKMAQPRQRTAVAAGR